MADTNNVYVATPDYVAGTFHRASLGSVLPTDAISDLDVAFVDLGYVGEDGYTYAINRESDDIKAFGGDTVATVQNDYNEELTVTLLESNNADVLKAVFGEDNVSVAGDAITVKRNKKRLPRESYVIDVMGQDGIYRRIVLPVAQVTGIGEITYVHTDVVKYELTIKPYPDTDGNTSYEYTDVDGS